jgi:hypothetical protein
MIGVILASNRDGRGEGDIPTRAFLDKTGEKQRGWENEPDQAHQGANSRIGRRRAGSDSTSLRHFHI